MALDREEIVEKRNQKVAKYLNYFGVIMAIFYLTIGVVFFFIKIIETLTQQEHYFVGGAFICYGIFRLYRVIKQL